MFWKFKVEPLLVDVMTRYDDNAREQALRKLYRKRKRAVPELVEQLKSSIFNCDKWFRYSDAAAQVLLALAQTDAGTRDLISKKLVAASKDRKGDFKVLPSYLLSALGYRNA